MGQWHSWGCGLSIPAIRLNCFDWKSPNCRALVNVKLKCQRYVLFLRWRHYRIMQQLYSTPPTHHLNGSAAAAIPKSQQWSIGCGPEQQRNLSTTSTPLLDLDWIGTLRLWFLECQAECTEVLLEQQQHVLMVDGGVQDQVELPHLQVTPPNQRPGHRL